MDVGTNHQNKDADTNDLNTPPPRTQEDLTPSLSHDTEWLAPTGTPPMLHRNRRVDVSIDTKTLPPQGEAETWGEEGVAAPRYISAWVLPQDDLDNMMATGAVAAPDIIYARGVQDNPSPDPTSFDRKDCALILFKIGV